ncbi:MAG: anhydro-N-acetylmuramic acid kinase [Flavobacteriales bacterium]|nr:anhydro-N-acetylmuramic acid kinase [Flavobacteriales bacterium]
MKVIGIMSGTSLDGLDLCCVEFSRTENRYSYCIHHTKTVEYSESWKEKLKNSISISSDKLLQLNVEFGEYIARQVNQFIEEFSIQNVDLISSHGHTVFHQPENKITYQIGCGNAIHLQTGIKTVADFRKQDVLLGGQGAPFVPIGDEFLFSDFDACINLGGFSNISFRENAQRIGFDICPVNIPLNQIAKLFGKEYDENGKLAQSGVFDDELFEKLNHLEYYKQEAPKSLGIEWYTSEFQTILSNFLKEKQITTVTEHIAKQISDVINAYNFGKILVTGGGAKNNYLVERINTKIKGTLSIPSEDIIDYKEALIFAFMGFLRVKGKVNVLKSVTGAKYNHSSGVVFKINMI